jgi:hypothetical protein
MVVEDIEIPMRCYTVLHEHMMKYNALVENLPYIREQIKQALPKFCSFYANVDLETLDVVIRDVESINDRLHDIYTSTDDPMPVNCDIPYSRLVKIAVNRFCVNNPEYDLIEEFHIKVYDHFKDHPQQRIMIDKCNYIIELRRKFKRDRKLLRKRLNKQRMSAITNKKITLNEIKGHPLYVNALISDVGMDKAFKILGY